MPLLVSRTATKLLIVLIALATAGVVFSLVLSARVSHMEQPPALAPNTDTSNEFSATGTSMTNVDWKEKLTPVQYHILREAGTEIPFTSPLDYETRPGTYVTADCGEPVFRSEQKYDSGTGWPSFWAPIATSSVILREDASIPFETRTEVLSHCGGHLGHVFDDGPAPTGKRYCMNGAALIFIPDATSTKP